VELAFFGNAVRAEVQVARQQREIAGAVREQVEQAVDAIGASTTAGHLRALHRSLPCGGFQSTRVSPEGRD